MPLPHETNFSNPLESMNAQRQAAMAGRLPAGEGGVRSTGPATPDAPLAPDSGGEFELSQDLGNPAEWVFGTEAAPSAVTSSSSVPAPVTHIHLSQGVKCKECDANLENKDELAKHMTKVHKRTATYDVGDAATLFQSLDLDAKDEGGLIWKAVCKTGTLALSPGPGQADVDKPLELTPELFDEVKKSVDEKAFPYVTVPATHNNGVMENTGYVREVDVRDSEDTNDPTGTKVLWAGIDFTEPEVREKAARGSIADTSVGIKFNYRNKRSGKTYPAALEHVALTNQPWVDGLVPFGQGQMLSQEGIVDAEDLETDWRGVFVEIPQAGNILPSGDESGSLPLSNPPSKMPETKTQPTTVEEVLASHQAEIERLRAMNEKQSQDLSLSQGTIAAQGQQLHAARVAEKVAAFEGQVPPGTLRLAQSLMLADVRDPGEDADMLTLSIPQEKGEAVERKLGATEIVETLLASLPSAKDPGGTPSVVLALAAETSKAPEEKARTASDDADDIEREMHPERYDSEGKRK